MAPRGGAQPASKESDEDGFRGDHFWMVQGGGGQQKKK